MTGHPIRSAQIHTFQRHDTFGGGINWIAKFYPYKTYPVIFTGETEQAVIEKAEAVRAEAIEKHEKDCITRQEASRRAKERAEKKKSEIAE